MAKSKGKVSKQPVKQVAKVAAKKVIQPAKKPIQENPPVAQQLPTEQPPETMVNEIMIQFGLSHEEAVTYIKNNATAQ